MITKGKLYRAILFIFAFSLTGNIFTLTTKAAVISPDKYYLETETSNLDNQKLVIYSTPNQEKPLTYNIRPIGIRKVGENNERIFYEPDVTNNQDAANWIKIIDNQVTVNPGETVEVKWHLTLPQNASCDTKLAGIAVSEVEPDNASDNGSNVSISNEVISQVHINTTREIDESCKYYEDLLLQEFSTTQTIPIFNYDYIEFTTLIENRSDYLSRNIKGYIELIGLGKKEVIEFNDSNLDIYPNSLRRFNSTWVDKDYPRGDFIKEIIYEFTHFKFGIYTARLGITKNIDTPMIATTNIFIIPVRVVIIITIIIAFILISVKNNYRTRKELNRLKSSPVNKTFSKVIKR